MYLRRIKSRTHLYILLLTFVMLIYIFYYYIHRHRKELTNVLPKQDKMFIRKTVYIAVVACGQKVQETLVMMKSALLFNVEPQIFLKFFIFTEDQLASTFKEKLKDWRYLLPNQFTFEILALQFPKVGESEWRNLFKPCAAQRLFLPTVLHTIDSVLYVDTDILFLSPVGEIWDVFSHFNETQLAAVTPEHENENIGWYNRFARHPFYGKMGINSGVMLMNLTRMRQIGWESLILPIYKEYKLRITWGDQDIINILFYFYSEKLYVIPCQYNYRPDHCMYMNVCNTTNSGIKVIHGNRGYFHTNKQPIFRILYEHFESYQINSDPYGNFLAPLEHLRFNADIFETGCGKMLDDFLRIAKQLFYIK